MDDECRRHTGQPNSTLVESGDLDAGSMQDVFAKDDRVGSCPTQQDNITSIETSCQEFRSPVNEFEIVLLSSVSGNGCAELEVHRHASGSDDHANDPNEKTQADATGQEKDGARSCKNASSHYSVEDQEECRKCADLPLLLGKLVSKGFRRTWRISVKAQ